MQGPLNAIRNPSRFPQRVKNIDLTIYDKNAGVGGTWYSNKYPVRDPILYNRCNCLTVPLCLGALV